MTASRLAMELMFTEVYKEHINSPIAEREIKCLQAQFPSVLQSIQDGDLFAGRMKLGSVAFSPDEPWGFGYCSSFEGMLHDSSRSEWSVDELRAFEALRTYWNHESTASKLRKQYPEYMQRILPTDNALDSYPAFPLYRVGGAQLDFGKLVRLGIPGLRERIEKRRLEGGVDQEVFQAMLQALQLLSDTCAFYTEQAKRLMVEAEQEERRTELQQMAEALERIRTEKPATLREAIQLVWLYSLLACVKNYSRMDVYLGDFYVNDLLSGRLTKESALRLMQSFWKLIADKKTTFQGRVIIGGRGRPNEENADQLALLAIEATRTVIEGEPQLSLRLYKGMNPALMGKALESIGEGRTYPMLYNDDVNVPAVQSAFAVSKDEAEMYCPFGCGEYVLEHRSFGTPSGAINLLKVLEITLRDGRDPVTGKHIGLSTGKPEDFHTFDDLWNAFCKQAAHFIEVLADQEILEYRFAGDTAPFLFLSMLYDDCIERGKAIFSGGVRYLGGTLETYGNTNTADSLIAIREIVYQRKLLTLEQLVVILDLNFQGYERERRMLAGAPKYGNDNELADGMAAKLHDFVCETIRKQHVRTGLHSYLNVIINNEMNTVLGRKTAASADGRPFGKPMANANNPSGGADKNGVTAFLNSLVKLDPGRHAGSVQNMKFSKELFTKQQDKLKALLDTYFDMGGTQAMITVVNRKDLENAMREPQKYTHLFVRVGGFSARFVELSLDVQEEVLSRTLY